MVMTATQHSHGIAEHNYSKNGKGRPQKQFQSNSNDTALVLEASLLRCDLINADTFRLTVLDPCVFPESFPLVEFQIVDDFVNNIR